MRDQDAAQDALQDVMVRIWEKSPLFDRARGDAMGWMVALARSVIFNRLAKRPAPALSLSDAEVALIVERLTVGQTRRWGRTCGAVSAASPKSSAAASSWLTTMD